MDHETVYGVMITGKSDERLPMAVNAIRSFLQQSYRRKKLIIVNDGESDCASGFTGTEIEELRLSGQYSLGTLRNIALEQIPSGAPWIQWDDDDWKHSCLIADQKRVLDLSGTEMCVLKAQVQYSFCKNTAWIKEAERIEGTILARKRDLFYPEIPKGEDTEYLRAFQKRFTSTYWNNPPHFYLRFLHENNTWEPEHFRLHLRRSDLWRLDWVSQSYLKSILPKYNWLLKEGWRHFREGRWPKD
jgi:glycosyltransferase involved in cell wall biosynthesis